MNTEKLFPSTSDLFKDIDRNAENRRYLRIGLMVVILLPVHFALDAISAPFRTIGWLVARQRR